MEPTLVLLPGLDGTGDLFAPLLAALRPDVPTAVVRYPDEPLDYAACEVIARAALPQNRPYVVLGESFSGPIAVAIAARAPPGLLGCILCASFVTSPRAILRVIKPLLHVFPPQWIPEAVAAHFLMGRFASPELRGLHTRVLRRVSPKTLASRLEAIANVDVRALLDRIRVPTLYLRATEDRLVPRSAAASFKRFAPSARVVEIEGPHFLLQANPLETARVISGFVREVA
jgi:pimeloyl-ACP methyl ester carboxylesterase